MQSIAELAKEKKISLFIDAMSAFGALPLDSKKTYFDAVMLDLNGFVAETNATNIFMIKDGVVFTPFPKACLPGITRGLIIYLCIYV